MPKSEQIVVRISDGSDFGRSDFGISDFRRSDFGFWTFRFRFDLLCSKLNNFRLVWTIVRISDANFRPKSERFDIRTKVNHPKSELVRISAFHCTIMKCPGMSCPSAPQRAGGRVRGKGGDASCKV